MPPRSRGIHPLKALQIYAVADDASLFWWKTQPQHSLMQRSAHRNCSRCPAQRPADHGANRAKSREEVDVGAPRGDEYRQPQDLAQQRGSETVGIDVVSVDESEVI